MSKRRSVEVYDTPSGLGGSFNVEIVEDIGADRVKVRVWCNSKPENLENWYRNAQSNRNH